MFSSIFGGGFDATKCKTALRLTVGRIKLLQNKKALTIKTFRKDIAALLSSGKEDSARIRVEALIQEQGNEVAYEILELYCELLAVRVQLIKQSKSLPEDMRESVSSVLYAAKRCSAQLPELVTVRQQLTYKYGKEYVLRAQNDEMCAQEGVNPRLSFSLAIRAPSTAEKAKLLSEIAQEFDVPWEPSGDLLESPEDGGAPDVSTLEADLGLAAPTPPAPASPLSPSPPTGSHPHPPAAQTQAQAPLPPPPADASIYPEITFSQATERELLGGSEGPSPPPSRGQQRCCD